MIRPENRMHAVTAEKALKNVYATVTADTITDMLADLRHLCDARGLDFFRLDRSGYRRYSNEGGAT